MIRSRLIPMAEEAASWWPVLLIAAGVTCLFVGMMHLTITKQQAREEHHSLACETFCGSRGMSHVVPPPSGFSPARCVCRDGLTVPL